MGSFGGMLQLSRLKRLLEERNQQPQDMLHRTEVPELPSDTSDATDEADLLELFKDPASLGRLKEHITNVPRREEFQPGSMDRITAALSSALDNRPHDRLGRVQTHLDRPYDEALEQHNQEGRGLSGLVQMEEGSLNRQRLGRQAVDTLKERNRSATETAEIRRQAATDRASSERERQIDKDEDRSSRERGDKRDDETRRSIAEMSKNNSLAIQAMKGANGKPPKKMWAYDPDKNANLFMDEDEVASQGYESKVGDLHIAKEKFHRTVEDRAIKAHEIITRRPDLIGILQGPMTTSKTALGSNDADAQTLVNLLAGLRAERLREEAGAALTPTELMVYDPVLPKLSGGFMGMGQSDEKMGEVLKQVALKARSQMRRRTHGSLPWDSAPDKDGWITVNGVRMRQKR